MGENCSASSRLIVQEGIKDALLARIKAHAREWPMGNPLDAVNRVRALVSQAHFDKECFYLGEGSTVVIGGTAKAGFVEPTILEVSKDAPQAREEIVGPILSRMTVDSFDEAIALANDTDYGLAASIYTANIKRAIRDARTIRAGTVTVNSFGEGDSTTPFGGFKASGFGGRDNGIHAHDQYTQLKTIWIDLSDDAGEVVNYDASRGKPFAVPSRACGVECHPWTRARLCQFERHANRRRCGERRGLCRSVCGTTAPTDDHKVKIVVLEAGLIAESSAGRDSGFMIDLPHELTSDDYAGAGDDRTLIVLNRNAISFASDAGDDDQISPTFRSRAQGERCSQRGRPCP
jgi:hypothetical protein